MTTAGGHTLLSDERLAMWRWPLAASACLLAIYTWVFWDFLAAQVRWALRHQADWGHTLVIPFIAGYLAWHNRERLRAVTFRTTWVGLVPVVLGIAWYSLCSLNEAARNHNLQALGVWLSLFGLVLLFFGFGAMRILWFPLAYLLVFGQSVSDRAMSIVTYRLQDLAAAGSYFVLVVLGFDVDLQGNTLTIIDGHGVANPLNVAEACSGMRMLMAFLALGVAMAYVGLDRFWQRAAIVILAVPTALFINVLRVVTLALLALVDTNFAAGDFHTFVGLVWLVPAVFIYLGLIWIVRAVVIEERPAKGPVPS